MKLRSRRTIAASVGVTAAVALTGSLLFLSPALAANATSISVSTTNVQAAAGTCVVVSYQPRNEFGEISPAPDTLTVTLTENPEGADQDIDFCSVGATVPTEAPSYNTGNDGATGGPATQNYTAGPGITPNQFGGANGGVPDIADNSSQTNTDPTSNFDNTNPSGIDRARYAYNGKDPIRVGFVGLTAGGATIKAFFDEKKPNAPGSPFCISGADYVQNSGPGCTEKAAPAVTFKITNGGLPGSQRASDAVTTLDIQPPNGVGAPGATQTFTVILKNSAGDTVRGVTPRVQVNSGGANPLSSPTCGESDNSGVSTCSFTGTNPGADQLTVWVQRVGGTAGIDANEVSRTTTRTTTKPAVNASEARYIDLTPKSSTLQPGQSATFTATITDVNGAPARQVSVVFTKSSQGSFPGGAQSVTTTTDETGRAFVGVNTFPTDRGTMTVTGTINTPNTQCTQTAGTGTGATSSTPAGRCADTASVSFTGAPVSPTPTPSATGSPSRRSLTLSTSTPDIQPTDDGVLNAFGEPNASVELRCYTRPDTNYFTARGPQNLSGSGALQFIINPGANTRCYVRYAGDEPSASDSVVINVHTTLSLSAYRDGVRKYHFQGTNLPRRAGQLITLYRWARRDNNGYCDPRIQSGDYNAQSSDPNCVAVRTATAYTNSTNVWRIDRTFTGSGQFVFQVRTTQTLTNANGVSNPRLTIIH